MKSIGLAIFQSITAVLTDRYGKDDQSLVSNLLKGARWCNYRTNLVGQSLLSNTPLHLGAGLCSTVIMSHASTISDGTRITTNEITFCLKLVFSNFVFFFFGSLTTPPDSDLTLVCWFFNHQPTILMITNDKHCLGGECCGSEYFFNGKLYSVKYVYQQNG